MMEVKRYPEYIMRYLRLRWGLQETDTNEDERFSSWTPDKVFSEVLRWNGLLGNWDKAIKGWILDIYGVDLDALEGR